ncbi:leucokinins-like [Anopheles aquasalis]|uniref:leucokinins-like n=1 Tax=Anopheles aquasalis TaxID=42839 RepID=UPI00215ACB37|nr:leucokinins-like [Anopheles aquasalis]
MAMFCLLLAAVAFVLASGPRVCRCDRPESIGRNTIDWYRHYEDGSNLIPVTKLATLAAQSPRYLAALQHASTNPLEMVVLESLVNRYRKYMVDKFARFDDVCASYAQPDEDMPGNEGDGGGASVASDQSSPPSVSGSDETVAAGGKSYTGQHLDESEGRTMKLPMMDTPDGDLCGKSAKHFYRCLQERIDDPQLVAIVNAYLEGNCYGGEIATQRDTMPKRDWPPKYVSKQKFHSWGGKRNGAQVFYPWGGKRTGTARAHKQPKVVIRNPFHSWGGKRSDLAGV